MAYQHTRPNHLFKCISRGAETDASGGGARLENPTAPETIDINLSQSVSSQSHTEEPEAGKEPIKPDRTR